ncbi:OprO/OprP family phosphate-selective porin [Govanella unica]|uniref:OprO/OprP family phosphate-selective porin n=1 Tax=Govanella unica TaxID=2975056 RepID=A0A9X3TYS4_9PROT|nr:porin [Govania unica]MDA5193989.1 OprO/OprP family phosphate-selective porin [Govania unica]
MEMLDSTNKRRLLQPLLSLMSATALCLIAISPAYADSTEDLLAVVQAQSAEIATLKARVEALEKPAPVAATAPAAHTAPQAVASAADTTITWKGAPVISSADGKFSFKPRGRIHVDAWGVNSRTDGLGYASGGEVRRARLGAEGKLYGDFNYMIEVDFAGNAVSLQDVYLSYALNKSTNVIAGYHKVPITLEDQTSDNYITFIERAAYATTFAPGRGPGLSAIWSGPRGMITAGVWGENENTARAGAADQDWFLGTRASYVPWQFANGLLHVGGSAYYLMAGKDIQRFRMRERPETHLASRLIDIGLLNIDNAKFAGLEAALIQGPLHITGEWGWQWVNRMGAPSLRFDGGYAQAGWFLTGEKRAYSANAGQFGRVQPHHALTDGGSGAFELAARYSVVDLEDGGVMGGVEKNWTLGLNWYANAYMRLMVNYVRFDVARSFATRPLGLPDHKGDAFGVRAQIDW